MGILSQQLNEIANEHEVNKLLQYALDRAKHSLKIFRDSGELSTGNLHVVRAIIDLIQDTEQKIEKIKEENC